MGFLFLVLIVVMIGLGGADLAGGAAAAHNVKRAGQESARLRAKTAEEVMGRAAREQDCYYRPDGKGIIVPNQNFYGDGSLKYDTRTGKSYEKGRYYCNSAGVTASCRNADPGMKRPPQR